MLHTAELVAAETDIPRHWGGLTRLVRHGQAAVGFAVQARQLGEALHNELVTADDGIGNQAQGAAASGRVHKVADPVNAVFTEDDVVAGTAHDKVVAAASGNAVGPITTEDHIARCATVDLVIASTAKQGIATTAGIKRVVAGHPHDDGLAHSGQCVGRHIPSHKSNVQAAVAVHRLHLECLNGLHHGV